MRIAWHLTMASMLSWVARAIPARKCVMEVHFNYGVFAPEAAQVCVAVSWLPLRQKFWLGDKFLELQNLTWMKQRSAGRTCQGHGKDVLQVDSVECHWRPVPSNFIGASVVGSQPQLEAGKTLWMGFATLQQFDSPFCHGRSCSSVVVSWLISMSHTQAIQ